jgi:hypothetical protein
MVIEVKRSQLKAALDRVYQRENEVSGENAKLIKGQLEMSTILIIIGTLLVTVAIVGLLYFNQITNIFPYIFIILFLILGLAISIRIPIVLGNNLQLLKFKLNSTKSNIQINSILGAIFICFFIVGTTTGFFQASTDHLDTTDTDLDSYEIHRFTVHPVYTDVNGDPRVNVDVVINAPKNIQDDNVLINVESWFAGERLEGRSQKVSNNLTLKESILIHDAEDTSYRVKLIVNNKVIEIQNYTSTSNLYVFQSEVKTKPLLKNKAEVTIVAYNDGSRRAEESVKIIARSSNILGSYYEETVINEQPIEADDTWEASFTINIDYFESEHTEIDVYLKHDDITSDKEILIVEFIQS